MLGFLPVVGVLFDVADGILYISEGNYLQAAISFASALPVVGSAVSAVSKGTKLCRAGKLMARSLALTEKMVVAANTMYETGKCAIDAYFAYENSGGKINGDVVKSAVGAVVMGGLTAFGIHGAANKVDNLSRAISDPTGCFVAGTQVPTVDGYKNIEDIEVGDQVYSENPYTGEKGYKKVVETYIKEKHTIVYLKVNNETIETTSEHPFWVEEENAFVKAEDLEVGDTLRLRDGETVTLEGIESKTSEDITKVYNFQVADWHTYYVTDMDILVHNNCVGLADGVGDVASGFEKWLNRGEKNNKVYTGIRGGEAVYTGITKQTLMARLYQHNHIGGKNFSRLEEMYGGLTRNQARALEQYGIENGPSGDNKIFSIGKKNKYYKQAMKWAEEYIENHKGE